jgi:hypothetical protein
MQNQTYTSNYKLLPSELLRNSVVEYLGLKNAILNLSLVSKEHRTVVKNSKLHINSVLYISISHNEGSTSKPVLFCYNGNKAVSFEDVLRNVTTDINLQKTFQKVSRNVICDYDNNNYPWTLSILLNDIITLDLITKLKKGIKGIDINRNIDHRRILYSLHSIICRSYTCYNDIDAVIQKAKDADHVATQVLLELHKEYSEKPAPSFPFW